MMAGDTMERNGTEYMAVAYNGTPSDFMPTDDDPQCKLCALMPNYCNMKVACHGEQPFVLVKSIYLKAMATIQ